MESSSRTPELDGVRGVAIALVIVGHAFAGPLAESGVTLFFGLSGFLITGLLLGEFARTGSVSLRRFYWRRTTRLAPPLIFCVLVMWMLVPSMAWANIVGPLTWTTNYLRVFGVEAPYFGHAWSLGVEEQFYLVWPIVFLLLSRLMRPVRALGWTVGILLSWRLILNIAGYSYYGYHAFETAGSTIAVGCLVAWSKVRIRKIEVVVASLFALITIPILLRVLDATPWIPLLVTPAVAGVVAGAEVLPPLRWRWLGFLGVTSYSVYLWHTPVYAALAAHGMPTAAGVAIGAALGLIAYAVVERPVMSLRAARQKRSRVSSPRGKGAVHSDEGH